MKNFKTRVVILLSLGFVLCFILLNFFFSPYPKFIINITPSVPYGVYYVSHKPAFDYGEYLAVHPPKKIKSLVLERHYLPRKNSFFVKKLIGKAGDSVCIKDKNFLVNGEDYGAILDQDVKERPLPKLDLCRFLKEGEFVVGLKNNRSFDSRYFGVVDLDGIFGVVKPILIWQ